VLERIGAGATAEMGRVAFLVIRIAIAVTFMCCTLSSGAYAIAPEGRTYEQVSQEFKAGYPVFAGTHINALAPGGESVKYVSVGAFAGSGESFALNPYVARRTPTGWVTTALFPFPGAGECYTGLELMSPDLSRFELLGNPGGTTRECQISSTLTVFEGEAGGSLAKVSPAMTTTGEENAGTIVGGSIDLTRELFSHQDNVTSHFLEEDETLSGNQLFEMEVGSPSVRFVALNNSGSQLTRYCDVNLGGSQEAFDAVSQPEASQVFFSVAINTRTSSDGTCQVGAEHPEELFARLGGTRTIEVSRPLTEGACSEVPCTRSEPPQAATFQGASADGSTVFFTSAQPLVSGDKDHTNNLYVATIGCPGGGDTCEPTQREVTSLELASPDPKAGEGAEVEPRVLAVSPDGSHAYFVARGVLTETPNSEGVTATRGAENLYAYDGNATDKLAFVGDLCSASEKSGELGDPHCPASLNETSQGEIGDDQLWLKSNFHEAQTTSSGAFLVFATYAQLISKGAEADVDSAKDVYRYDDATGALQRISIGESGADGNGNDSAYDASIAGTHFRGALQQQAEMESRAVAESGAPVVFTTSAPLSIHAINGKPDVYAWSEGHVALISSGTAIEADEEPIVDPSGRDIVFMTSAGLAPGDTDGLRDVYDARVGEGFPQPPASPEACSGDACYGPLSAPAPALVPGSVSQSPGGNLAPPKAKGKPAPAKKTKAKQTKTKRKRTSKSARRRKVKGRNGR
jgi:hypothetical protein